jgi:hypothetical protein
MSAHLDVRHQKRADDGKTNARRNLLAFPGISADSNAASTKTGEQHNFLDTLTSNKQQQTSCLAKVREVILSCV